MNDVGHQPGDTIRVTLGSDAFAPTRRNTRSARWDATNRRWLVTTVPRDVAITVTATAAPDNAAPSLVGGKPGPTA